METQKSKVYFSDLRALPGTSLPEKLKKLIRRAGIGDIDFDKKMTAIKIHFGEPGNLSFLRPNWAKAVADVVKELGGKPFLTDCNTLYVGRRKDALEHLESALENGFSPFSTGCQIIIGDGLKGTDETYVPVKDGELVKEAKIGTAIMDADIFISLNHFKGHEATGFGGALKNIGMGCGSRAGKMEMHNSGKPTVDQERCVGCRTCSKNCAHGAISFDEHRKASINHTKCVGCGRCLGSCNFDAIYNENSSAVKELDMKIAEYSKAVLDGRPNFHINLVIDISPYCDCHGENDVPILPDIGMFASFDPVALDQACVDACNAQKPMPGSLLDDRMHEEGFCDHHDHFVNTTPDSGWEYCLEHAEKIGLGTRQYELITI
ncbi:4Fe-4S ferredoxin [Drancourtella sp. An210]|nr:4Fe-4S ferredoxin [Drancourtella sp. An210]